MNRLKSYLNIRMRIRLLILLTLIGTVPLIAQEQGGDLPTLEIETVTVIGRRVVVLPKARKGEVYDTTHYILPPGDTLLFGERISNLGGTGGPIPGFREFDFPLKLDAEASIGSYLSPRALLRAEYIRRTFDVSGILDYRGTMGHIDSAEASSLLIGAQISKAFGDETLPLNRFRLSGGLEHLGDSYFLYGNSVTRFDRSRAITRFNVGLRSEEELPVEFALDFRLTSTSVEDRDADTLRDVSATTPAFSADVAGAIADTALRGRLKLDFTTTSMNYSVPTLTPACFSIRGDMEWIPAPGVFLTGGLVYASGENSDSGSTSLILPRLSARYEPGTGISVFSWYMPELRAPSYSSRILHAPYVDREIVLRPERVPVLVVAGARISMPTVTVEVRGRYEKGEGTPVVVATAPGNLSYGHVNSTRIGAEGSVRVAITDAIAVTGDGIFRSATVDSTGEELPMTPSVDLRGHLDFALTPKIDIFGSVTFQSMQRTVLGAGTLPDDGQQIPARFLLGGGTSYRILPNVQAFAEVTNLLNYSYELWQNYSAPGFELRGGVRATF